MKTRTKVIWIVLNTTLVVLLVGVLVWLAHQPERAPKNNGSGTDDADAPSEATLRIGLIPERDIFEQHRRYEALAGYLSARLDGPVKLVTLSTYEAALQDFRDRKIDGAFLGSLVAVLAMDRLGAKSLVKPELLDGTSTYHGVIFVRDDSPIETLDDLKGQQIAMVRTTTAGHVFPGCVLMKLNLLDEFQMPNIVWVGTHDDVVEMVVEGQVAAGAVKNLRLDAALAAHPDWRIRELATGECVPNNALLLRSDISSELAEQISEILMAMPSDPRGRETLETMGVKRFLPCRAQEYAAVYDMVECIRPLWDIIGVPGPAPTRPSDWPQTDCEEDGLCYVENY
ncbi:MAG: phosphate/phosphite/phosphonate ABC transporter substrate-binding protein [Planctomycetota bacterium]|jgi:phosphonate transport system substrate-binding protein